MSRTDRLDTDAFGMTTVIAGAVNTPFRFAGQSGYQNDVASGLMLLGHRYYDASIGRFISRDPIQDGYNWYAYCNNDPVNKIDPEGTNITLVGFAVVAMVVAISVGIAIHYSQNPPPLPSLPSWSSHDEPAPQPTPTPTPVPTFPDNPGDMDNYLGMPGQPIPDGPTTPGRNKIKWNPSDDVEIILEQHPYDTGAPDWHKGPHWHIKTPRNPHERFLPGDPIPGL